MSTFKYVKLAAQIFVPLIFINTGIAYAADEENLSSSASCSNMSQESQLTQNKKLAEINGRFAVKLLISSAKEKKQNTIVSPLGVVSVLSSLEIGADAVMKDAISRTLYTNQLKDGISLLRRDLRLVSAIANSETTPFKSIGGVYLDASIPVQPGINDLIKAEVGSNVTVVDFGNTKSVTKINSQVSTETNGRIKSILEEGEKPALLALNTLHFKDCWSQAFDSSLTKNAIFTDSSGKSRDVPMMHKEGEMSYFKNKKYTAIELPFTDSRFSFTMVTTNDKVGSPDAFGEAAGIIAGSGFTAGRVKLTIPKFTSNEQADLLDVLSKMGLSKGIVSETGLSGFAEGLSLAAVRQKTFVEVSENGMEAAAVTAAIALRSADPVNQKPISISFDKPFVFSLRHKATGLVLMNGFIGVIDPSIDTPNR